MDKKCFLTNYWPRLNDPWTSLLDPDSIKWTIITLSFSFLFTAIKWAIMKISMGQQAPALGSIGTHRTHFSTSLLYPWTIPDAKQWMAQPKSTFIDRFSMEKQHQWTTSSAYGNYDSETQIVLWKCPF